MSKKYLCVEKKNYHGLRANRPSDFRLELDSPKVAYSQGFLAGCDLGRGIEQSQTWWRGRGRKQAGAYALGVAAGKKARRRG